MACEWIELTSQDTGNPVFVNIASAIVIEGYKGGSRIRFLAGDDYLDVHVTQTPKEILGPVGGIETSEKS